MYGVQVSKLLRFLNGAGLLEFNWSTLLHYVTY